MPRRSPASPRASPRTRRRAQASPTCHDVRVRVTEAGLVVNYHCRVEPDLDVASVHELVDDLERRVRVRTSGDPARRRPCRADAAIEQRRSCNSWSSVRASRSPLVLAARCPPRSAITLLSLDRPSGPDMRTDTPQLVRLEDYRPSDFLIDRVELDIRLHPTRDAGDRRASPCGRTRRAARARRSCSTATSSRSWRVALDGEPLPAARLRGDAAGADARAIRRAGPSR